MEGFEEEVARQRKTGEGDKRQSSARSHRGARRTSVEGGSGGGGGEKKQVAFIRSTSLHVDVFFLFFS